MCEEVVRHFQSKGCESIGAANQSASFRYFRNFASCFSVVYRPKIRVLCAAGVCPNAYDSFASALHAWLGVSCSFVESQSIDWQMKVFHPEKLRL
jgi:hypothetical protein